MDSEQQARLLEQAKVGDAEAFERLMVPHLSMLFAYSRVLCGDYHAAQDVVQETVLVAYRKLGHYFPEADFATWLRAIARREALAVRRRLNRPEVFLEGAIEEYYQSPKPEIASRHQEALAACLELLQGRLSQVVRGFYFDGKPLAELADLWGTTASAVKQLLYRARLALRECVHRRLGLEGAEQWQQFANRSRSS